MPLLAALALVPLLLALNAFFVAAEYALVAIRPTQIEALRVRRPSRSVQTLEKLKSSPSDALAAIQVCITMANLLLGWIGEPAISLLLEKILGAVLHLLPATLFHWLSFLVGFVAVTLLTVVLSELVPKVLTLQHVEHVALVVARPVALVCRAIGPLVSLMNLTANLITRSLGLGRVQDAAKQGHSTDEIRLIATEAAADGVLTLAERTMILNALSLGRRTARQIMVSRVHVDYLDLRRTMAENLRVLETHLHSRLPLCDGGMDKVFGVVTTKEFLWASVQEQSTESSVLQLLARPAVFVPETLTVDKLLPLFHEHQTQMLFLVSEYGGVEGLVTLRDVIDEILDEPATSPPG